MAYLLFVLVSAAFAFLAYFVTGYIYIGASIGIGFLILSFLFLAPMLKRRREKEKRRHECYRFINSFLIDLSVTDSPEEAYRAASNDAKGEEKEVLEGMNDAPVIERIEYMNSYFSEPYYPMFVSLISVYLEQGGDVLKMADPLLKEASNSEKHGDSMDKQRNAFLVQEISLWGLSYIVLLLIRVSLNSFYANLSKSMLYCVVATSYFLVAMLGFYLFMRRYARDGVSVLKGKKNGK